MPPSIFFSFHPFANIWSAVPKLHAIRRTRSQEPDHVHVDERYFFQVQNKLRSILLKLFLQFPNVLRLEVTDHADRRHSTVRILFDPHCLLDSVEASAFWYWQLDCQRNLLNRRQLQQEQFLSSQES